MSSNLCRYCLVIVILLRVCRCIFISYLLLWWTLSFIFQERLNGTLKRATGLLTTGISPERVDEGNKQLGILLKEFEDSLSTLNKQKAEEDAKALAKGVDKVPTTINKRLADASAAAAASAASVVSQSTVSAEVVKR